MLGSSVRFSIKTPFGTLYEFALKLVGFRFESEGDGTPLSCRFVVSGFISGGDNLLRFLVCV
jgi:hypothetical protein